MNLAVKKKAFLLTVSIPLSLGIISAQQMPLYSQYMMNGFVFNPAVAGSDGFTTISLSSRDHMMGFENSPKTFVIGVQTRLMKTNFQIRRSVLSKKNKAYKRTGRVGLGAYVFNDVNGYVERTGGQLTYAYHITARQTQYSLGIAFTTFQFKLNTSRFDPRYQDPIYNDAFSNKMLVPDATIGGYMLKSNSFLGLSAANIFQTRIKIGSESYDYRMYRHYFLLGGFRFLSNETFSYEPSFMVKSTETLAVQADLQFRCYYQKDYYLGLTYRTKSAVGFMLGAKYNKLFIGYAFDYSLTPFSLYSIGAHELNLALKLGDNTRRYRWMVRY